MYVTGEQKMEYYQFASKLLECRLRPTYDSRILTTIDEFGEPLGCIVYRYITDKNLEMMVALPYGAGGVSREFVHRMFHFPFVQLRLPHISTVADEANEASVKLTLHVGFTIEGRMRRIYNGRDGIIFGMCRDECRWIGPRFRSEHGQEIHTVA